MPHRQKNQLLFNKYPFIVNNVMDRVEIYNKNIHNKTGLYYVETNSYFPLRGNGWYPLPLINYCLEIKQINHKNIREAIERCKLSTIKLMKNIKFSKVKKAYFSPILR